MIIDIEHHWTMGANKGSSKSGRIVERHRDEKGNIRLRIYEAAGSVESHLEFMDDVGIDVAVLSTNPELALERSKQWNDLCAGVIKEYPKRFAGFASIPPLGGKPALDELERAIKGLGLKGVHIMAQSGGHTLDDRAYWPFYEKVSELRVPIDVHIQSTPAGFEGLNAAYPLSYILAREFDICAETFRICLGGILEEFPDLVFIINHFGGGISAVLERVDAYMSYVGAGWPDFYPDKPLITKPWKHYFNKLYFNMAGREQGMDTVRCALTNISPDRMLFGTDWPFNYDNDAKGAREYIADIKKLDLPGAAVENMLGGNAAKLLSIG